jgi:hypothetical protein
MIPKGRFLSEKCDDVGIGSQDFIVAEGQQTKDAWRWMRMDEE